MFKKMLLSGLISFLMIISCALPLMAQTTQNINLKEGFNFVSFTVSGLPAAAELKTQNTAVNDIYSYNAAAGSFLSLGEGTLTTLSAGKGYIILANSQASLTVSGSQISDIGVISLKQGFNLVGFSKNPETITFSQLMSKFPTISGMYNWNSSAGNFVSVVKNGETITQLDGSDPSTGAGKSYFMNIASETTLNIDGSTIVIGDGKLTAASPVFTPDGGQFSDFANIVITCATEGASIRYTTDSTNPSATNGMDYTAPVNLTAAITIKAIAIKAGMNDSAIAKTFFELIDKTDSPVISTNEITFTGSTEITITCPAYGATIYYSTDDGPFEISNSSVYEGPFVITTTSTVKAMAVVKTKAYSDVVSVKFTETTEPSSVADPAISPNGGEFRQTTEVAISCATEGATIKYTLDGTTPSATAGTLYTGKITLSSSSTIKAIAVKDSMEPSTLIEAKFDITIPPVNPSLQDLTIAGNSKKALIAINISGDSAGTTEVVGTLPASTAAPVVRMIFNSNEKPAYFDRQNAPSSDASAAAPLMAPGKINETDTKYTFKVSMDDINFINMPATLKYGTSTSKCLIYLADSIAAPATFDWNATGRKFDNDIYAKETGAFGNPTDVDANGKVVILYYDFGPKEVFTVGYFYSIDLIPNRCNNMEIFYMNIKWGVMEPGSSELTDPMDKTMIGTLTHEFQHLINYGQRVMIQKLPAMDSWIDEGLANSASNYIDTTRGESLVGTFKNDSSSLIRNGWPLCAWNGKFEDYAQTFAFIQYCKNQSPEREAMFKKLINHQYGDYRCIESVMKTQNSLFTDFASLLVGFRTANLVNADGIYGYGQEKTAFDYNTAIMSPQSTANVKLAPGGAVYIFPSAADLTNFTPSGQANNIRFIRVNK